MTTPKMQHLPPELLSETFKTYVLREWHSREPSRHRVVFRSNLTTLLRVNKKWHSVVIDTPALWSYLELKPRLPLETHLAARIFESLLRGISLHLDMSKQHPLHIELNLRKLHSRNSVSIPLANAFADRAVELVCKNNNRWQWMSLYVLPASVKQIAIVIMHTPQLEYLFLKVRDRFAPDDSVASRMHLSLTSRLQSVTCFGHCTLKVILPMNPYSCDNLMSLDITVGDLALAQMYDIFRYCPRLNSMKTVVKRLSGEDPRDNVDLTHSSLKLLDLKIHDLRSKPRAYLTPLRFPLLDELVLCLWHGAVDLTGFLSHHSSNVTKLDLNADAWSEAKILDYLSLLPHLTNVRIRQPWLTVTALKRFTHPHPIPDRRNTFCRYLQHLEMQIEDCYPERLARMLRSRLPRKQKRLENMQKFTERDSMRDEAWLESLLLAGEDWCRMVDPDQAPYAAWISRGFRIDTPPDAPWVYEDFQESEDEDEKTDEEEDGEEDGEDGEEDGEEGEEDDGEEDEEDEETDEEDEEDEDNEDEREEE